MASYGGMLRFTLETHVAQDGGTTFRDVDIEIIVSISIYVEETLDNFGY